MKLIKAAWFTSMGSFKPIGIVVIENEIRQRKAYIGLGQGLDEDMDAGRIMETGAPVLKGVLEGVIKEL